VDAIEELLQKLQEKVGDKFNNISSMLGGKDKEAVNAVFDFAEALCLVQTDSDLLLALLQSRDYDTSLS
jgi:hypothetical protein